MGDENRTSAKRRMPVSVALALASFTGLAVALVPAIARAQQSGSGATDPSNFASIVVNPPVSGTGFTFTNGVLTPELGLEFRVRIP